MLLPAQHVFLHVVQVEFQVVDDLVVNRPSEKVELSNGCADGVLLFVVEGDARPPSERIEQHFLKGLELRPIVHIHVEVFLFAIFGEHVRYIVLLAIVRDVPIDQTQRQVGLVVYDMC